jgi:hypothetical protein
MLAIAAVSINRSENALRATTVHDAGGISGRLSVSPKYLPGSANFDYAVVDIGFVFRLNVYMDGILAGHGESRWDPMSELYATAGASTGGHLDDAFDDCLEGH